MSFALRTTTVFAVAFMALSMATPAFGQLRIVNYNCAHMGGDGPAFQQVLTAAHSDNKVGWAKPVDIFIFQEVSSSTVAELQSLVNAAAPAGTTYSRATFTTSGTEDSAAGSQCAFYRVQTISETTAAHADIFTGASRNADRWLFRLNGYSSTAAQLYAYSMHLKASVGSETDRQTGALAVRANADALGAGVRAIFVGDFNVYNNTEPAYLTFLAGGNAQAFDALGTGSWSGSSRAFVHTQSPREISGALVGGGMDDRFDLHLATAGVTDGEGISMISGTYRAFGNDGLHYNLAINTNGNSYYPGDSARSNALALAIFNASDHIPVIVDYQVPAVMSATLLAIPPRVIQGSSVTAQVQVKNVASVVTPLGSDELDYVVTGTNRLTGSFSGIAPLSPAVATVNLQLNTGTIGLFAVEAQATSSSEGVQNAAIVMPAECSIVSRAKPSWQSTSIVTAITVPVAIPVGSGVVNVDVPLHNVGWGTLQAMLDADFVQLPTSSSVSVVGSLPQSIMATPGVLHLRVNPVGLPVGLTNVSGTLLTSDENIPGEGDATLSFTIAITVGSAPRQGDINRDGIVNAIDLASLLAQWGGPGSADINLSGLVDGLDLAILLGNWG